LGRTLAPGLSSPLAQSCGIRSEGTEIHGFYERSSPFRDGPQDVKTAIESLRPRWGWIVALGGLIAGMGVAALILVVSATIASV